MKYAPMRFDGMSLQHNPETLSVTGKNHIGEIASLCCDADSRALGKKLCVISGEGEFCGEDCIARYQALERLRIDAKRAKLVLPKLEPMYAYLKEVAVTAKPVDNVLRYRFVFVEAQSPRRTGQEENYYVTVSAGESLWDIAYAAGEPIETLTALNPQIPLIDELKRGERVRLC